MGSPDGGDGETGDRRHLSAHTLSRRSFLAGVASAAAVGSGRRLVGQEPAPALALPPFLARPTTRSILIQARNGEIDAHARLEIRERGPTEWRLVAEERLVAADEFMAWNVGELTASTAYEYRISLGDTAGEPAPSTGGSFTTQRTGEESFSAALITDPHTGSFPDGSSPVAVLDDVVRNVVADRPEFVIALGDNVAWYTSRELAQEDARGAVYAYDMYRRHVGPLAGSCPHFGLIGNWEGESGKFPPESQALMSAVRRQFMPNPDHRTYPQGGNEDEDYFAFDWGPVLFVALNVQSYSVPSGSLATVLDDVTRIEDWTLGPDQIAWLEGVLTGSDHPFKFVCIHHAVGGEAGNAHDTLYGRGGPRAARVGEQARIHEMMTDLGVQIFFFGHDHVFLDEVVDGIHYTLPGSCGAPWKFDTGVTGYRSYWPDSGHGRLHVRPDRATVEFVNQVGQVIHAFTVEPR